jgi:hypothetical protein
MEHVHDYVDRGKGFDEKFSIMIGHKLVLAASLLMETERDLGVA